MSSHDSNDILLEISWWPILQNNESSVYQLFPTASRWQDKSAASANSSALMAGLFDQIAEPYTLQYEIHNLLNRFWILGEYPIGQKGCCQNSWIASQTEAFFVPKFLQALNQRR